jgi:hypothetical protein
MKNSRIIKNIIILIIAPFIAWGLLFLMNNFSWLTASVLDIWEVQKVKDEWWDLAYKTEWWIFEIFWSEKVQASDNIVVKVLYNPDKIVLDSWLLSWINHEIISDNTWNLEVSLSELKDRDYKEWWLEIPYTWDETQILLGDSRKVNQKWEKELLSIWNLNNSEEHSILP